MALFNWNDKYSVGNEEIDKQHKKLFEIINNVNDMAKLGITPEITRILEELKAYTALHFRYEEELFSKTNYPNSVQHKQHHLDLLKQVNDFENKLNSNVKISIVSITRFLNSWLVDHIMKEDFTYKPYITKK